MSAAASSAQVVTLRNLPERLTVEAMITAESCPTVQHGVRQLQEDWGRCPMATSEILKSGDSLS